MTHSPTPQTSILPRQARFPHLLVGLLLLLGTALGAPLGLAKDPQDSPASARTDAALPDLPTGITSFGAARQGDSLWVFGGHQGTPHKYHRDDVFRPLLRLKVDAAESETPATWEELPSDEPALGPALLPHSSGLIRVGGMQPRNGPDEDAAMFSVPFVRRYNPSRGEWEDLPDLPEPRSSHDAWLVGDVAYVAGGWEMRGSEGSFWHNDVLILDLSAEEPAWRQVEAPFRRRALAVAATKEKLYCLGGLDNGGDTSLEVDVFDLETEEWSKGPELPDSPIKGFGLAATVHEDELYITGFSGGVHRLDREKGEWIEVARLSEGRMFPRLVPLDETRLVVIGGGSREGRVRELEVIDLEKS